jgi:transposase
MNRTAKIIGLDIAKNVFALGGIDQHGLAVMKRLLSRDEVLRVFANIPPTSVAIEACAGSHYWARALAKQGHEVRLIAAQHARVYVSRNKNDMNDALAIAEARSRAKTKYVPINTEAQQDLQMLHRSRQALMVERTGMINRIRAFAAEYGQVFPLGVAKFLQGIRDWLSGPENGLSGSALTTFQDLREQLAEKEMRIELYDRRLAQAAREDARAIKLMEVPGIGKITATAVLASVSDARHYASGRDFAANLGVIPKEHSSGGKQRLYGISKRGDAYLRTLLIHGARSALRCAGDKPDKMLAWAKKIQERRGYNVAAVALANKIARVIWAILAHERQYVPVWSKTATRPV